MKKSITKGIFLAILAAISYSLSTPVSKVLLNHVSPTLLAGFLYIGAFLCMSFLSVLKSIFKIKKDERKLEKSDAVYVVFMILLDIAAPIFLLIGLSLTSSSTVSLLNNFEIVATSIIAFLIFKEKISFRLMLGIILITISCVLLSINGDVDISIDIGSIFVLLAAICWGFENNCTRKISNKNPLQIVMVKGIFSGIGSLIIGLMMNESIDDIKFIIYALLLGFIAYGLSIYFYIKSQRILGASRTSAYYAVAPFISVLLSFIIFKEQINSLFIIALLTMIIGAVISSSDESLFKKVKNKEDMTE